MPSKIKELEACYAVEQYPQIKEGRHQRGQA